MVCPTEVRWIESQVTQMAAGGMRVWAFAKKTLPERQTTIGHDDLRSGLLFIGLQGMIDPPRPEAFKAVAACQKVGVRIKMITLELRFRWTRSARSD